MRATMIGIALLMIAGAGSAEVAGCGGAPQSAPEVAGNYADNVGGLQAVSKRF